MTNNQTINKAPETVKTAEFGCRNCLWNCIECKGGEKYEAHTTYSGEESCKGYTYFD